MCTFPLVTWDSPFLLSVLSITCCRNQLEQPEIAWTEGVTVQVDQESGGWAFDTLAAIGFGIRWLWNSLCCRGLQILGDWWGKGAWPHRASWRSSGWREFGRARYPIHIGSGAPSLHILLGASGDHPKFLFWLQGLLHGLLHLQLICDTGKFWSDEW